jgi:Xaa-Pro aminopeptidase
MSKMFIENRKRFIELMENGSIAVFDSGQAPHITTDQFYPYSPNRSFYYLTGLNVENCRLMIIKNKKQFLTFLFVEETTEYMRKWVGEKMSKETASETSGIVSNRVFYLSEFDGIFRNAMLSSGGFGFEPPSILYLDLYRYKVNVKPYALSQFKDLIASKYSSEFKLLANSCKVLMEFFDISILKFSTFALFIFTKNF